MVVFVALALVLVLIVALVVSLGDDDDDAGEIGDVPLVLVRLGEDGMSLLDDEGRETDRLEWEPEDRAPVGAAPGRVVAGRTSDAGILRVWDLGAASVEEVDVGIEEGLVRVLSASTAVVGDVSGGDAAVVDLEELTVTSVREELDADGTSFLMAVEPSADAIVLTGMDGASPLSALVTADGRVVRVDGHAVDARGTTALVVTRTDAGAEIGFVRDGEPVGDAVDLGDDDARAVMADESTAVIVQEDGAVDRLRVGSDELDRVVELDIGELERLFALREDRFMVVGTGSTVLIDASGAVLRSWDPVDGEPIVSLTWGTACAIVQPGSAPIFESSDVDVISLEDGVTVGKLAGSPQLWSADGCSASSFADSPVAVIDGEEVDVEELVDDAHGEVRSVVAIDPHDRRVVVRVESPEGDPGMLLVDLDTGDAIELERDVYVFVPAPD